MRISNPQPVNARLSILRKPAGGREKYGKTNMITSASIRRISVRLMLAFRTLEGNMNRFSLEELPSVMTVDEVSSWDLHQNLPLTHQRKPTAWRKSRAFLSDR